MATELASSYLTRVGAKFKRAGRECVTTCPDCGRESKCYISDATWLWHCKVCDARGNEISFKAAAGDVYGISSESVAYRNDAAEALARAFIERSGTGSGNVDADRFKQAADDLWSLPDALTAREYVSARGISEQTARAAGIGWVQYGPGGATGGPGSVPAPTGPPKIRFDGAEDVDGAPMGSGWISLPSCTGHRPSGGADLTTLAMVKYRSVPPAEKQYLREAGGVTSLFIPIGPLDFSKTVVVAAGEMDALSLTEAGVRNVVGVTGGEGAWPAAFTEQLAEAQRIVVVYDNDAPGREGAAKVVAAMGSHRCVSVSLPADYTDCNDALVSGWLADNASALVASAKVGAERAIIRPTEVFDEVFDPRWLHKGKQIGIEAFDTLVGGIRASEIITITGDPGTGKSTLASQIAIEAARQGMPVLFAALELGRRRQTAKWIRQIVGKDPVLLDSDERAQAFDLLSALPLFLLDHFGAIKPEPLRNTIAHAISAIGVELVIIDHLHFAIEGGPEERHQIDGLMAVYAQIANAMGVTIINVAHAKGGGEEGRIVQGADLKGSSSIVQVSDVVLSTWRPRPADREVQTDANGHALASLYSMKMRSEHGREGSAALLFDPVASVFLDVPPGYAEPRRARRPATKPKNTEIRF